jgi:hypothetical protein
MKLAALALGVCVIALLLLAPTLVPDNEPPGDIGQVSLQPPADRGGRAAAGADGVTRHRPRRRSSPGDHEGQGIRRARSSKVRPNARSISRVVRGGHEDVALPGRSPAAYPPTLRRRDDPATESDAAPTPRNTPAPGGRPAPRDSGPHGVPGPIPVSSEPADAADPPDPPDPPEEDATAAGADPSDQADDPEIAPDGSEDETP